MSNPTMISLFLQDMWLMIHGGYPITFTNLKLENQYGLCFHAGRCFMRRTLNDLLIDDSGGDEDISYIFNHKEVEHYENEVDKYTNPRRLAFIEKYRHKA